MPGDLLDTAIVQDVLKKSGNTISFGDVKLGVGREQVKQYIKDNPKTAKDIRAAVWTKVKEQRAVEK